MITVPLDFERFSPLYNPATLPMAFGIDVWKVGENAISATEQAPATNLKTAGEGVKLALRSLGGEAAARQEQIASPLMYAISVVDGSSFITNVDSLTDQSAQQVDVNVVMKAYENDYGNALASVVNDIA